MQLNEEIRESKTRNRTAVITPFNKYGGRQYSIVMMERGKLITRSFKDRAANITKARQIAREWCR